jgi:hypothetical protein
MWDPRHLTTLYTCTRIALLYVYIMGLQKLLETRSPTSYAQFTALWCAAGFRLTSRLESEHAVSSKKCFRLADFCVSLVVPTERECISVMYITRIRDVLGSYLGRDIGCPFSVGFLSSSMEMQDRYLYWATIVYFQIL